MSLVHELEKSGNWLFRRRSWLPLTILIPAAAYLFIANRSVIYFNYTWEIVCILVSVAGELLRASTVGHVPRNTSGRNVIDQLADDLNTTGLYSVVRHPLYIGNFLMWLGPVLFLRSVWWVIIFILRNLLLTLQTQPGRGKRSFAPFDPHQEEPWTAPT